MNKAMIWPCAVVGLLSLNFVVVGITLYHAGSNTTMVPEPRYYERAVHFDEQIALRAESAKLGWTATAEITPGPGGTPTLRVRVLDRKGAPVSGAAVRADVIPNLRPGAREALNFLENPTGPGDYLTPLASTTQGLWTVRLEARRGGDVFGCELSTPMAANSR